MSLASRSGSFSGLLARPEKPSDRINNLSKSTAKGIVRVGLQLRAFLEEEQDGTR